MHLKEVSGKKDEKRFLSFRKKKYQSDAKFIDNNYFMLQEIFARKLHFVNSVDIFPVMVLADEGDTGNSTALNRNNVDTTEKGNAICPEDILCEAVIAYAKELPEYIQICFFEAQEGFEDAVKIIVDHAGKIGKEHGCNRIVIGLFGHVNYGLGFLASHYDSMNSFSSLGNPEYYNRYFENLGCESVKLNTYYSYDLEHKLDRYRKLIEKLNRNYTFRTFDKKHFERDSRIYTDLNNECFPEHKYYYHREYEDDMEMLKELFLFMKEDSVFYAYHGDKPVGFIMWYPDYNELARPGEIFGTKHFFRNKLKGGKIKTAKVMEWGVLKEYRGSGLPVALVDKVQKTLSNYNCSFVESSWILDENEDSNSICTAICDERYKDYVVYEKAIV